MTVKHSIFGYLLGEGFRNVFHNKNHRVRHLQLCVPLC